MNGIIGQRKYQIFISSTYQDLIDERRAVTEVILGMGHIPVGMELFEAGNEDQWTYIKNRIFEVDYYLVIVAERYGSLSSDGLSYTEMEYRYALDNGVPLAALLLDQSQRLTWPRSKVDFENQSKIEDFRKLCQKKLVAYWSDAGSLSSKCQLALNGLIRHFPRTGWVSADQAISPQVTSELARLSEENAKLREELSKYTGSKGETEASRIAAVLEESILTKIQNLAQKFGPVYTEMIKDPYLSQALKLSSLYEFLLTKTEPMFDGTSADMAQGLLSDYIKERLPEQELRSELLQDCVRSVMLQMRAFGIIEVYETQSRTPTGRLIKHLRLTEAARRGFLFLFSRNVEDTERTNVE